VIMGVQDERSDGDDISGIAGLGARSPWLAWPMTIAMLSLAGIPGTVGFIGKFQLIHALVNGDYTWLAIVLVLGSMISLGYYLRVIASIWMRAPTPSPGPGYTAESARRILAPIAGGSPEADALGSDGAATVASSSSLSTRFPEVTLVAVVFGAACVVFGIFPSPLFNLAAHAGQAIGGLF
jgi:NADH-quinone oxidoreductase subunit N